MSKVLAGITTSLDGYVTGPNDRLGAGLGEGGERLHYWVFGGPWSYDSPARREPAAWKLVGNTPLIPLEIERRKMRFGASPRATLIPNSRVLDAIV